LSLSIIDSLINYTSPLFLKREWV